VEKAVVGAIAVRKSFLSRTVRPCTASPTGLDVLRYPVVGGKLGKVLAAGSRQRLGACLQNRNDLRLDDCIEGLLELGADDFDDQSFNIASVLER